MLPENTCWIEYYAPREERKNSLRVEHAGNPQALAAIEEEQREIDMYRKYQRWYGSVFFVMKAV